jgi:hypothetical protein
MNCDDFVSIFSTGSVFSKARARLHARRCAKCAAARDWLVRLRGELQAPVELSGSHRRVWERAAIVEVQPTASHWMLSPRLAMAGGFAIAAGIIVMLVLSRPADQANERTIVKKSQQSNTSTVETAPLKIPPQHFVELELGLTQISTDLDRLAEQAARLEARRGLSELAATYQSLGTPDST